MDLGSLMMAVGIQADSQAFKDFENDVDKVFSNVQNSGSKSSGGIGAAFKGAMPSIGSGIASAAKIGMAGLSMVGDAAIGAGKQLFEMATETAAAGDRVDKMSQSLGLSREGFQEWDYILSQNGASIDSMKAGMTKLNKTMDDASNGSDKAVEKFGAIGLSMEDLAGKSREDIFEMTIEGLQGIENESERAALGQELLGKSSVDLAALLAGTAEGTEELRQNAHDMGMVMSDSAVDGAANLTDSIDNLQRGFEGFKNKVISEFLPGINQVTDGLGLLLKGDFEGGAELIAEGLDGIITEAAEGLVKVVEILGELLPTLLPVLADAALNLMQSILDTITENIGPLMDTVVDVITTLANFVVENLPLIVSAGIEILVALALGLANAIPDLIPVMIDAVGTIITTLIDNLPLLIDAAFQIIGALALGLIDALPTLVAQLPKILESIVNYFVNNYPALLKQGIELIVSLGKGIIQAIPGLLISFGEVFVGLISAGADVVSSFVNIGKDIVSGIWEGIKGMKTWLTDKVKGFFGGITSGVKGLLGIKSPSRVYASIGSDMGAGVGVGFDDSMLEVSKEIEASIPTNFDLDIDTDFTRTSKNTLVNNYKVEQESSFERVRQQKQDLPRTSQKGKGDLHIHIDKVFGDKQGMRRFSRDLKEMLNEIGMETGDIVIA